MWVRLRTNEGGDIGRLDIGTNPGADGDVDAYWWEWYVEGVRNTGGVWSWAWKQSLGGTRYVIELVENGSAFADLTHGRINFSYEGSEPNHPWFKSSDRGNGSFAPPGGPGPQPIMPAFEWTVLLIR
jgi:hypothetical protein